MGGLLPHSAKTSMGIRRRARGEWSAGAWVDDRERLLRVARTIQALMERLGQETIASLETRIARLDDLDRETREELEENLGAAKRELSEERSLTVTAVERRHEVTHEGEDAEEVVRSVDPRELERLVLSAPDFPGRARNGITVEMSRQRGVSLQVQGEDPQWVKGALVNLQDELEKSVPRWTWMRGSVGPFVFVGGIAVAGLIAMAPLLSLGDFLLVGGLLLVFVIIFSTAFEPVFRRILPGFEIVETGQKGSISRVLALVGGLAGSFVLGLIGNLLTR